MGDKAEAMQIDDIDFDLQELDAAIAESGLDREFPLPQAVQRKLAAQGTTLVSFAVAAESDESFDAMLSLLDAPQSQEEMAFLFGYCEHARSELGTALAQFEEKLELRGTLYRRIDRARKLCMEAVRAAVV